MFQDSYLFLSASLAKLTEALRTAVKKEHCTKCTTLQECTYCAALRPVEDVFPNTCSYVSKNFGQEHFSLLLAKQPYPYSYVDDYLKLRETSLPPKEAFYNKLTESHISQEEYDHALCVWNRLGLKTLEQYAALYLSLDVYLLGWSISPSVLL